MRFSSKRFHTKIWRFYLPTNRQRKSMMNFRRINLDDRSMFIYVLWLLSALKCDETLRSSMRCNVQVLSNPVISDNEVWSRRTSGERDEETDSNVACRWRFISVGVQWTTLHTMNTTRLLGADWRSAAFTVHDTTTTSRAPRVDQSASEVIASGDAKTSRRRAPLHSPLATLRHAPHSTLSALGYSCGCALPSLLFPSPFVTQSHANLPLGRNCRESIRSRADQRPTSPSCSTKRTMNTNNM